MHLERLANTRVLQQFLFSFFIVQEPFFRSLRNLGPPPNRFSLSIPLVCVFIRSKARLLGRVCGSDLFVCRGGRVVNAAVRGMVLWNGAKVRAQNPLLHGGVGNGVLKEVTRSRQADVLKGLASGALAGRREVLGLLFCLASSLLLCFLGGLVLISGSLFGFLGSSYSFS